MTIHEAFSSWSQQEGYPVLIVERNYDKNTVMLRQRRYLTPKGIGQDNSSWWIPYNFATANNSNFVETTPMGWLTPHEQHKYVSVNSSLNEWILFNKQQTGYYRVLYDKHNYKLLSKQLNGDNFTVIHRLNRAQLLDDTFEFVEQGIVSVSTFFRLFSYLSRENEYAPWQTASVILEKMVRLLRSRPCYPRLQAYLIDLLTEPYLDIGIDDRWNEPILKRPTRTNIANLACEIGVPSCQRATYLQLRLVLFHGYFLHPNLHGFVYANGIRNASISEVEQLWLYLNTSRVDDERLAIVSGFGRVKTIDLLPDYLSKTIQDTSALSKTERIALFNSIVVRDEYGLSLAIRFVAENGEQINKQLQDLNKVVMSMAARVVTPDARARVSLQNK